MNGKDSITINCSKIKAWDAITGFSQYFKWNSVINNIEGELKEGNNVKLICLSNSESKVTYDAFVEKLKEGKEIKLRVNNNFNKFTYYIRVNEIKDDEVEVVQGKEFYGICNLIKKTYMDKEIKKLKIMNKELKGYILSNTAKQSAK